MQDIFLNIINLLDQGNYDGILSSISKEKKNGEIDPVLLIFENEVLLLQGKVDASSEHVTKLQNMTLTKLQDIAVLTQEAIIHWLKGDIDQAANVIIKAKEIEVPSKKDAFFNYWYSYMYNASGIIYILLGDPHQAKIELDNAYKHAKSSGSLRKVTSSIDNLAIVHRLLGNFDIAIFYQDESLKLREEMNDQHGIALSKGNLAELYEIIGELDKSLQYSKEIIPIFREFGTNEEVGMCYHNIGRVYFQLNQLQEAKGNFEKAFEYRKKAENKVRLAPTMYFRILTAINLQDIALAGDLLEQFRQYPIHENKVIKLNFDLSQAHYLVATENYDEAEKTLNILLKENDFDIELNIIAMITLIKLYSLNFDNQKQKIQKLVTQLKKIAHQKNNTILDIEIMILQSKIALLQNNVEKALDLLEVAEENAENHSFKRQLRKIKSNQHHIGSNYNVNKEIDMINLNEYLDEFLKSSHGY